MDNKHESIEKDAIMHEKRKKPQADRLGKALLFTLLLAGLAVAVLGRQNTPQAMAAAVNAQQGNVSYSDGNFTLPPGVQTFAGTTTDLRGGAQSLTSPVYTPPANFAFTIFSGSSGIYVDAESPSCAGVAPIIDQQGPSSIQVTITCTAGAGAVAANAAFAPTAGQFTLDTEGNMVPTGKGGKGTPPKFSWQAKATGVSIVLEDTSPGQPASAARMTAKPGVNTTTLAYFNKHYVEILTDATMPQLNAHVQGAGNGTVNWTMQITFSRPNRNDSSTITASGNPLPVQAPWNITQNLNGNFYGGKAVLTALFNGKNLKLTFYIRGKSASEANVKQYIAAHTTKPVRVLAGGASVPVLWYATAIAQVESGIQKGRRFLQFNLLGTLGPNPDTNPQEIQGTPNRSGGGQGWGIYQLTNLPPSVSQTQLPSINDLWNWHQNVKDAIKLMLEKRRYVRRLLRRHFSPRKIKALCNAPIKLDGVTFRCGTSHIPIDILDIEAYNGFGPGLAIRYHRHQKRWRPNPVADGYVRLVINAFRFPK